MRQQAAEAANTASSQTANDQAPNYQRLVDLRASIVSKVEKLRSSDTSAEMRTELKRDLGALNDQMRQFTDECATVTERVPIDQALLRIASPARSLLTGRTTAQRSERETDPVENFVDSVRLDLRQRLSAVEFQFEGLLSTVRLSGRRWEVEEAKRALRDALPAYLARLDELVATEQTALWKRERDQTILAERSIVNIDWEGGTLRELVKSVRSSVECNVVLADPSVGGLAIPALAVTRVAPEVFFRSLQSLPLAEDSQLLVTVVAPEAGGEGKPSQEKPSIDTRPVIVIARKPVTVAESPSALVTQRIFDLSDWVGADAKSIKSLIEAIDFAMQADGSADRVKVRYHEPSRILFAKGPSGSIQLIDEIVTAFRNKK